MKLHHPDEPKRVVEAEGHRAVLLKKCGWVEKKTAAEAKKDDNK